MCILDPLRDRYIVLVALSLIRLPVVLFNTINPHHRQGDEIGILH